MNPSSVSKRAIYRLLPFDMVFNFVLPGLGFSLGVPNPWRAAIVSFGVCLARNLLWVLLLRALLVPVDAWQQKRRGRGDDLFRPALDAARTAPSRFVVGYSALWACAMAVLFFYIMYVDTDASALSPRFPVAAALTLLSVTLGAGSLAYTMSGATLTELCIPLAVESRNRGLGALHPTSPVRTRIAMFSMVIALTPLGWLTAVGYRAVDVSAAEKAESTARAAVLSAVSSVAQDSRSQAATTLFRIGPSASSNVPADLADWVARAPASVLVGSRTDAKLDRAAAFARAADGHTALAVTTVSPGPSQMFLLAAGMFFLAVILWAPICSFFYGKDMADGILRVTRAAGRVVEVGDLSKMEPLPELGTDELGELTTHFNTLIDRLRDLARGSLQVANGALGVTIEGDGELPSAFRGMLTNLRDLVGQIRATAVQLASAAAEIYSASQEQEAAASQQSAGIGEVSRTVDSLSDAAGHIAESAAAVLGDAERTRTTTDQMIARIGDLNAHAGRITELLESIREVADRSDLLALNGSLEATRAGEAGRGFSLVAAEMRRLAERVTATVEDVRSLVGDIRSSGASTVMATEQSRKLAESTTDAARRISLVTQQQRTAMEQVSTSVREIADVLAQAAAATTQTRVSTEDLKAQADKLEALLRRFALEDRSAA